MAPIRAAARALSALASLLAVIWPIAVAAAASTGEMRLFLEAAFCVFLVRAALAVRGPAQKLLPSLLGAAVSAAALALHADEAVLWYPVLVNASFLSLFALSFLGQETVVERIASRMSRAPLPPRGRQYCRRVTLAWCVFFTANGLVALATVLSGSREAWVLWNGVLSYGAIGLMMAGEYLVRRRVLRDA
ncbi:MAG: hypothetical protein MR009_00735 [Sutterellaceae bacterium]|nr:hypothetical protein [Sutterellaceae bacterium]MDD7442683.1 hypothetical protein [Sutterellaceae bacterium]MDY2867638.1 hypothetical protein [Mesosutterella sp.]